MIPGWEIGDPTLTVVDNQYDTNFGDPRYGDLDLLARDLRPAGDAARRAPTR